ncbi:excinuclease ABC subunit UvrB [Myxococcota bacterium]|nr:excinuclease ABC subunit UvrB [Myxococcota bacterium]MBU1382254.1 excinuclease ABC subunit UvrB [Myxococcota bacterium]MBU1498267.1 excinuclease ABC subunit UvrB [Myxococcota bacterium]
MNRPFRMETQFSCAGDQATAVKSLVEALKQGEKYQVLLGITGSGKTFTMAKVIEEVQKPVLILAHNKTLAAQLFSEFRELFPNNAVHYFVSYYDYYQPEAYVPASDLYIEKDSQINEEIDRLRHAATNSLLSRRDTIIVASVSCIFGIGAPVYYRDLAVFIEKGMNLERDDFLARLVEIQYERNDYDFFRGKFRVRGDTVEVFPADSDTTAVRIEWFGDEIEEIRIIDPLEGRTIEKVDEAIIFPSSHYVIPQENLKGAIDSIREELRERITFYKENMKYLELERISLRTHSDLEMLETTGFCKGIENYSRHLDGRKPDLPPSTLLNYFPDDFLMFIDESHQTLPQVRAMYRGDRSRKSSLVEYGFRLPSALDNRPLNFDEFETLLNQVVYVSATPGPYEVAKAQGVMVEQIIRPTGLLDPEIEVRPASNQVEDLVSEIDSVVKVGGKVLVVTLTKRMSEHLAEYFLELKIRARYLHSEVDTFDRMELLRDLRLGEFDVLIGINLLREGLDLPEVRLVAILDADMEGFLRSEQALFQICGRAARNVDGRVIMYASRVTRAMEAVISETTRRRALQEKHNTANGIVPATILKKVSDVGELIGRASKDRTPAISEASSSSIDIGELRKKMLKHARNLEFEEAARLRDYISALEREMVMGKK